MVEAVPNKPVQVVETDQRQEYLEAFRWMLKGRLLDEKFAALYRSSKIFGGVFIGIGQEALSASMGMVLRRSDIFAPLIRDAAGRLAFGERPIDALRTYLGSPLGPMRARDGNVHRGDPHNGYVPMISHLGATISVVNGMLMGRRFRGVRDCVGMASIGDGGTSTGAFHEALNQAAIERLPLVVVVANNQYAYSTPTKKQFACARLSDRARGYGMTGHDVDGTDLAECLRVVGHAVQLARQGEGPQLVVAELLRLCGHGEHDDASYVDPALKASPLGRDCLQVARQTIRERGWADEATLEAWRRECIREIEAGVAQVEKEPPPDPYREDWNALASRFLAEPMGEVSDT